MINIRRVCEQDVDALVSLKAAVHALHATSRPDIFKAMHPDETAAWLRNRLADANVHGWMAEADQNPVGYVLAVRRSCDEATGKCARQWLELDEVVVDASCRRRGVARSLVQQAVAYAQQLGIEAVELTAWSFNEPARAAFEAIGFEPMIVRYRLHESSEE